jgi:dTDP-glucose 4,6-dehydratase
VSNSRSTTTASSEDRSRLAMTNEVRDSVTMSDATTHDRPRQTRLSRVLVTGGAGFVGGHLCEVLLNGGVEVVCVDDLSTSAPGAHERLADRPGYRFLRHDVSEPLPREYRNARFDGVFHLASPASPIDYLRMPTATLRVGASGTAVALEVAERCGARFVLASTSEVYGDPLEHPQRETYWGNVNPIGPRSVYDEAKRYAEALTFATLRERGVSIGVARIFNTYGPRMRADDGRAVPTFCRQALDGRPITVSGNGSQTRSLCYVDDTVAGLIALANCDFTGPVNIGNPDELTVLRIAELIRDLVGGESSIEFVAPVADDPQRRCPDITLARQRLGWAPAVNYAQGLATTVDYFRSTRPALAERQ